VARPSETSIIARAPAAARRRALAEPRRRPAIGLDEGIRPGRRALEHGEPGRRAPERPRDADDVARARPVAPDELLLAVGPPDDGHAENDHRGA
jgi:hypothetical protein